MTYSVPFIELLESRPTKSFSSFPINSFAMSNLGPRRIERIQGESHEIRECCWGSRQQLATETRPQGALPDSYKCALEGYHATDPRVLCLRRHVNQTVLKASYQDSLYLHLPINSQGGDLKWRSLLCSLQDWLVWIMASHWKFKLNFYDVQPSGAEAERSTRLG